MLRAIIEGGYYDRNDVMQWEAKRMAIARRKFGLASSHAPLEDQRFELAAHKIALGHAKVRKILGRGPWLSKKITRLTTSLSGKFRRFSVCEIEISGGSAQHFAEWFKSRNDLNDEAAMLLACPDHYIITRDVHGKQLVVETTGGSPLPGEFTIDYDDISGLKTPPNQDYPFQISGVARLADGLVIGGVRHQFRQEGEGFRALLTVEFPRAVPHYMIKQHCWHLAVEFSNWIEAAAQ